MRLKTGPRWYRSFALFPVRITGTDVEVWLEFYWEYTADKSRRAIETRLLENPPPGEGPARVPNRPPPPPRARI